MYPQHPLDPLHSRSARPRLRVLPGGLSSPGQPRPGHGAPQARSGRLFRHTDGLLAGYCVAALATVAAVACGGTRHPVLAVAVLAAGLIAAGARLTLPAALGSGVIGWLFFDGFVIGRHASLGWDGVREAWWLAVLLAAAAGGHALGRACRT